METTNNLRVAGTTLLASPDQIKTELPMSLSAAPGVGGHPLFVPIFFMATIVNYLPVLLSRPAAVPIELGMLAVPHAAFVVWLLYIDRLMRTQRATELARFRQLRDQPQGTPKT